jgi:hypothetical protein
MQEDCKFEDNMGKVKASKGLGVGLGEHLPGMRKALYSIPNSEKKRKEGMSMSVISALWRLEQEDPKFEASLSYKVRPCLIKQKTRAESWRLMSATLDTYLGG